MIVKHSHANAGDRGGKELNDFVGTWILEARRRHLAVEVVIAEPPADEVAHNLLAGGCHDHLPLNQRHKANRHPVMQLVAHCLLLLWIIHGRVGLFDGRWHFSDKVLVSLHLASFVLSLVCISWSHFVTLEEGDQSAELGFDSSSSEALRCWLRRRTVLTHVDGSPPLLRKSRLSESLWRLARPLLALLRRLVESVTWLPGPPGRLTAQLHRDSHWEPRLSDHQRLTSQLWPEVRRRTPVGVACSGDLPSCWSEVAMLGSALVRALLA